MFVLNENSCWLSNVDNDLDSIVKLVRSLMCCLKFILKKYNIKGKPKSMVKATFLYNQSWFQRSLDTYLKTRSDHFRIMAGNTLYV